MSFAKGRPSIHAAIASTVSASLPKNPCWDSGSQGPALRADSRRSP